MSTKEDILDLLRDHICPGCLDEDNSPSGTAHPSCVSLWEDIKLIEENIE